MKKIDDYYGKTTVVQAVAGSGKTTFLFGLIEQATQERGYPSEECFLFTLNRALADKIRKKVKGKAKVKTFHSYALQVVRQFYRELGYTQKPIKFSGSNDKKLFLNIASK